MANCKDIGYYEDLIRSRMDEGLITTYDIDTVMRSLEKKFSLTDYQVIRRTGENNNGDDYILIIVPNNESKETIGDIKHYMNTCGFFLSENRLENNMFVLRFEQKYTKDVTEDILRNCNFLYHLTPSVCVDKILKKGLIPKSKNAIFKYPDRLFFMRQDTPENMLYKFFRALAKVRNLSSYSLRNIKDYGRHSLITIDTTELPKDVTFYVDSMMPYAIFTYDVIPPSAFYGITPYGV